MASPQVDRDAFPETVWPFRGVAPPLVDPSSRVAAWLTHPPGIILSYGEGVEVDEEVATFVSVRGYGALRDAHGGAGPFYFVHDFTRAKGYSTGGRKILTDWGVKVRKEVAALVVIAPHEAPMVRMGLSAASVVLRAAGIELYDADSLRGAVAKFGLTARP